MSINAFSQNYRIISSDSARKSIFGQKSEQIGVIKRNSCPIYKTYEGYIIYSSVSRYSVLFSDISHLNKFEDSERIVSNLETDDIREEEKHKILKINESIKEYIKELEEKFKIELSMAAISSLDSLDNKISQFGIEKLSDRDVFLISLYLDEFFRSNTHSHWKIERISTLNVYWIPYIETLEQKEYSFFRTINKSYLDNESGRLNLRVNYLLEWAKYKGLQPLTKEHIEFIKKNLVSDYIEN